MLNATEPILVNSDVVDRGYKNCRRATRSFLKGKRWPASNLPGDRRRALDALLYNLMRSIDLMELESPNGLELVVWHEIRDDLSDAFGDHCAAPELAAIADASRRYGIPKQFIFDPLRGADLWIRNHRFNTFDELESFCSYVGGSSLASAVPVVGLVRPDYEVAAIQTGKAIMLTQILANCLSDMKRNWVFFAIEDLENYGVEVAQLKLLVSGKSFRFLIRLYVSRIEHWFHEGSCLVQHLDFDGKRTLKAILDWHWTMLMNIKANPECVLSPQGALSRREQWALQSRHLMGLEREIPIVIDIDDPH